MSSELTNGSIPCSNDDDISIEEIEDTINQLINDNLDEQIIDYDEDDEKYYRHDRDRFNNFEQIDYNNSDNDDNNNEDEFVEDDEDEFVEDDEDITMDDIDRAIEQLKVTIIEKVCILEKFAISLMFSNHDDISCPICMNDNININDYSALSCGHSCCNSCMANTKKCYMCRKEIVEL